MGKTNGFYSNSQFRDDYADTLLSLEWMTKYEGVIRSFFPEIWTDIPQLNIPYIQYGLSSLGVGWRHTQQFIKIMVLLEECKIIDRSNKMIKRSMMPLDTSKLR